MSLLPSLAEAERARELLARDLAPTRLIPAAELSRRAGGSVWLKLENELPTGSFKVRGALYALARAVERSAITRVTTASTGNHGAAVSFAARALGVRATIFLPSRPNPVKRARILEHGAEVVEVGADLADARAAAEAFAGRAGAYLLDDATDAELPAGPATIALEILEEAESVRTVCVPVGDTALIRGVASALKEHDAAIRVVGVQAEGAPAYERAWRSGEAEPTASGDTIADGLATRVPDARNVSAIRQVVDEMVLVSDEELLDAMRLLLVHEHVLAEPAGAAALAGALRSGALHPGTVLLVTGGNPSPEVLARLVARVV